MVSIRMNYIKDNIYNTFKMHHIKTKIIKMVWVKKYTHILKIKEFFKMIYKLIKEELILTIIIKIHYNTISQ